MFECSNTLTCLKANCFPEFIKNTAWDLGLDLSIETEEMGWLIKKQTTRFKVKHESEEKINEFIAIVDEAVKEYHIRMENIRARHRC